MNIHVKHWLPRFKISLSLFFLFSTFFANAAPPF